MPRLPRLAGTTTPQVAKVEAEKLAVDLAVVEGNAGQGAERVVMGSAKVAARQAADSSEVMAEVSAVAVASPAESRVVMKAVDHSRRS